ncbi:MAG: prolipoprotein diacylglyceryl transferase [Spirochaetes bacterium]|nr:prolipoprotein diacylglyceryl transferase [Spirochaetota bacterium]
MLSFINYPSWLTPEIFPGLLPIRWYGLMYIAAFVTAYFLVRKQVKEKNFEITNDNLVNLFSWGILGILLGARIFHALVYDTSGVYWLLRWDSITQSWVWGNPLLIFWPFDKNFNFTGLQGMSYHGGVIGGVIAIFTFCKLKKICFFKLGDMLAVAIPAGYTFGRLGNFANAELYGRVTTAPWGMVFPNAMPFNIRETWVAEVAAKVGMDLSAVGTFVNLPRHPSQLYQALLEGIILWAFLWFFMRKRNFAPGTLIGTYFIGYGFVRFFIEYFRAPDRNIGFILQLSSKPSHIYRLDSFLNFTLGQLLCFLMIAGGALFIFYAYKRQRRELTEPEKAPPIKPPSNMHKKRK